MCGFDANFLCADGFYIARRAVCAGAALLDIDDDHFFARMAGVRQDISCLVGGGEVSGARKGVAYLCRASVVFSSFPSALSPES
jgi:hypothetical protein